MQLSQVVEKTEEQQACNVQQGSQNDVQVINSVRSVIFPKFFKQLNAQQNFKMKRQMLKKQKSVLFSQKKIHNHLKDLIFNEIQEILPGKQRTCKVISEKQSLGLNRDSRESNSNRKSSRNKNLFKKRDEVVKDGNKIFGEWRNNQLHGDVEIFYKNGFVFKGQFEYGIRIRGHFKFENGYEYTGGFLGDKFRGYGQLKLPNGKLICGDWQEQLVDGKAEIRYPTGEVYYGEIQNFKKHGKGYLFFNDGYKYVGEFCQGHITGYGEYYQNERLLGKGQWKDGQMLQEQGQSGQNIFEHENKAKDTSFLHKYIKKGQHAHDRALKQKNGVKQKSLKCSIALFEKQTQKSLHE